MFLGLILVLLFKVANNRPTEKRVRVRVRKTDSNTLIHVYSTNFVIPHNRPKDN